ncbi:flagellar biosynthetic protein FliO [Reinekea marina]|uniref:Flagellar protein n=1 Tax=Reinekea marina TaxID=1310421 RepID=A0ABV7WM91_9GAMM|nr:flagellar biosynthetic protein FliO [Reinekea marina]MDN3649372.1 flagellar biosynthetic protein FliO [Reinekea marina]
MKIFIVLIMGVLTSAQSIAAPLNYTSSQDYVKVFLMLILIVGLIFACAWLVRRMSGGLSVNQRHIQVLSVMPLGTREKLMIIKAAHETLLIGVTPNGINTLHRYDEPIDLNDAIQRSPFADRLKGLLKGDERDSSSTNQDNTSQGT